MTLNFKLQKHVVCANHIYVGPATMRLTGICLGCFLVYVMFAVYGGGGSRLRWKCPEPSEICINACKQTQPVTVKVLPEVNRRRRSVAGMRSPHVLWDSLTPE